MTMALVVASADYGAAAYFLAWIVLGKFILLALFLAVMLEAFESKYQVRRKGWGPRRQHAGAALSSCVILLSQCTTDCCSSALDWVTCHDAPTQHCSPLPPFRSRPRPRAAS